MNLAETIWQQINMNGSAIPMSWGSHALKVLPEGIIDNDFDCAQGGLQFKVQGALWNGHVRVVLNWDDTYEVYIGRVRKGEWTKKSSWGGVFFDQLTDLIDGEVETTHSALCG